MRVFQTENMKSLIHQLNCINSPKHTMTAKVLSSVLQRRSICCSQEEMIHNCLNTASKELP